MLKELTMLMFVMIVEATICHIKQVIISLAILVAMPVILVACCIAAVVLAVFNTNYAANRVITETFYKIQEIHESWNSKREEE